MASQFTHSHNLISIGGIGLAGIGLTGVTCQAGHLCCLVTKLVFGLLPAVVLVAWHGSQTMVLDHPRLLECLCELWALWPVIIALAKAV